jgi:hypothetical protein
MAVPQTFGGAADGQFLTVIQNRSALADTSVAAASIDDALD